MKKSQSISRKPKQKKHKNNRERIFLPKESKWEWFICGLIIFVGFLFLFYKSYSPIQGESYLRNRITSSFLAVSIMCIISTIFGYTFFKEWAIDIYAKYKNSQKFSLDDIGISLWLICVLLSVFNLIFLVDWTNWRSYIIHISTVTAVSFSRVLTHIFKKIWEKVKTWFTKR